MIRWLQVAMVIISCKQTGMDSQIKEGDIGGLYLNTTALENIVVEQRSEDNTDLLKFKLRALGTLDMLVTERLTLHYVILSLLEDASTCVLRDVQLGTEHRIAKEKDCANNLLDSLVADCVAASEGRFTVDEDEGYFMCEFPAGNEAIRIPSYCFSENSCSQAQSEPSGVDLATLKQELLTCQKQTDADDIVINGEDFYCNCSDTRELECNDEGRYYFFH